MKEILTLEVVVGRGQVQMEMDKVKAVKEQKTPTKIKEVESFLGFANFYKQFIKNFSHTAKPLNELKGKKDWKWEEEHQRAFEELKNKNKKLTDTHSSKERRKIPSRDRHIRTCNRGSFIPRIRWKMETNCISIQNNATYRKKL